MDEKICLVCGECDAVQQTLCQAHFKILMREPDVPGIPCTLEPRDPEAESYGA